MRRSEASPEAETTSYSPDRINVTISSDVPAGLLFTLHPVACSKLCTQSTVLSLEPSSTYPAQEMMLTAPSPAPSEACFLTSGGCAPPGPVPLLFWPQPAR